MRDHAQLVAVVRAICARVKPDVELWTLDGPTAIAKKWRRSSPLSSGERVLFHVAWAVWNSTSTKLLVGELLAGLDGSNLAFVASLLAAMADGSSLAIDAWLAQQDPKRPPALKYGPDGVQTLSYQQQKLLAFLQSQGPAGLRSMRESSMLAGWDLNHPDNLEHVVSQLEQLAERGLVALSDSGTWNLVPQVRDVMNVATTYQHRGFEEVGHG